MRSLLSVLLVLSLMSVPLIASADPPPDGEPPAQSPGTTCVEVNAGNTPPVYTYECTNVTSPP